MSDSAPNQDYPIGDLVKATVQTDRLMELLESIRTSRLVALNRLETDLDNCVVEFGKLVEKLIPEDHTIAMRYLTKIRDYRHQYPRLKTGDRALREQAQKILDGIK